MLEWHVHVLSIDLDTFGVNVAVLKDAVWIAGGGSLVTKVPWKPLQTSSFPTHPHTARPVITGAMDTAAIYRTKQSARRGEG